MSSLTYIGIAEKLFAFSEAELISINSNVSFPEFLYNLFGDIEL